MKRTEGFGQALESHREITISVRGRRSGREVSLPVWFALEGETLYLLPVRGSKSQWYRNLQANPDLGIRAGRQEIRVRAQPMLDARMAETVANRLRAKYGAGDVAKWYSGFDACVVVPLAASKAA